jgi:hypothetical protein
VTGAGAEPARSPDHPLGDDRRGQHPGGRRQQNRDDAEPRGRRQDDDGEYDRDDGVLEQISTPKPVLALAAAAVERPGAGHTIAGRPGSGLVAAGGLGTHLRFPTRT